MTAKMKFDGERQRYTIQAHNERFAIMTKPFNARKTYLYTITDLKRGVRGPCNLIFGLPCDVDSPYEAGQLLDMLASGTVEVSHRKCVDLSLGEAEAISAICVQS